jgi:hypothetical protein
MYSPDTSRAETAIHDTGTYGIESAVDGSDGVCFESAMAARTLETKRGIAVVVAVVPSTGQKPVRFSYGVVPRLFLTFRERERPEST